MKQAKHKLPTKYHLCEWLFPDSLKLNKADIRKEMPKRCMKQKHEIHQRKTGRLKRKSEEAIHLYFGQSTLFFSYSLFTPAERKYCITLFDISIALLCPAPASSTIQIIARGRSSLFENPAKRDVLILPEI